MLKGRLRSVENYCFSAVPKDEEHQEMKDGKSTVSSPDELDQAKVHKYIHNNK